jgi:putative tryptophan/tyrosine transport system substrate-binding protein
MKRREFIAGLGRAVAAWPLGARAQQPALPVIGVLGSQTESEGAPSVAAFRQGLADSGYVERQNVEILYRWSDGQVDHFPSLVADLVRRRVAVIAAPGSGTRAALAAKAATTTIPIVFSVGSDPVEQGLVASLSHPGGNLTGSTVLAQELTAKTLELLHSTVPAATSVGFLIDPRMPYAQAQLREAERAASVLGVGLVVANAGNRGEIEPGFTYLVGQRIGALLIGASVSFYSRRDQLSALAARYSLPTMYTERAFVDAGGLMSYAAKRTDADRLAGTYVARILKGEKPADLPVQQVSKVDLVINMKTAKALGLTVPLPLLALADEVIE